MALRTVFGGSRFVRWTLGPALVATAIGLAAWSPAWSLAGAGAVAALLLFALAVFSPVRFEWAGRTVTALVALLYAAYLVRELRTLADGAPFFAAPPSPALALLGALVIGLPALAWTLRGRGEAPLALAPDDPLLADAVRSARRTLPELRALRAQEAGPAAVKWALTPDGGAVEHVWGEVLALHVEEVVVRPLSRPITQRARLAAPLAIPLAAIEDWQVTLPDGSVRGSFTTLAMIAACRRDGRPIPRALRRVRFLDAEEPAPEIARGAAS